MNDVDAISDDALRSQTQLTSALAATCRGVTRFATTLAASKLNAGSTMLRVIARRGRNGATKFALIRIGDARGIDSR